MQHTSDSPQVPAVTAWPPRRWLLPEAAGAVVVVGVLYLLLVALSVWGDYTGQGGQVDIETGEPVPYDAGAAWASSFAGFPSDLTWPALWWAGTAASLLLLSGHVVLRAGARIAVAGLVALAASAPTTVDMLRYLVVSDGWGGGPAGLWLMMLLATPLVGAGVWAVAIGLRSLPLLITRAGAMKDPGEEQPDARQVYGES